MDGASLGLIAISYAAALIFVVGVGGQILKWWMTPVPFPLTKFPAVSNNGAAFGKTLIDTLFFRSLWRRNMEVWIAGWGFHLFLALLILGHMVGISAEGLQFVSFGVAPSDSRQMSAAMGLVIGAGLTAGLLYLLARRVIQARIRAISTPEDYGALIFLLLIVMSGMIMRLSGEVNLEAVHHFVSGLARFTPGPAPDNIWFRIHYLLVCLFLMWFPFSKLLHSCGAFMSRWLITRVYPRQVVFKNE